MRAVDPRADSHNSEFKHDRPVKRSRFARVSRARCDDQINRFWTLAFLVRLDVKGNPLSFRKRLKSGTFDGGDMDEHIAPAVIGLDESISPLAIKKFDGTRHGHRHTPLAAIRNAPAQSTRWLDRTFVTEGIGHVVSRTKGLSHFTVPLPGMARKSALATRKHNTDQHELAMVLASHLSFRAGVVLASRAQHKRRASVARQHVGEFPRHAA